MDVKTHFIALIIGFLLDKILGDPSWLPHPIIWFGKVVAKCDKIFNREKYKVIKGICVTLFLISIVSIGFYLLIYFTSQISLYLVLAIESLFVFFGIAGTTLIREGKAVFQELDKSLDAGRKQVSRIVGRDTTNLNREQIYAATLETMAENLSDGLVAPLFWYGLFGIPGIMTYKMINTLDSMIGYKSDEYIEFGKFAAKLDDVANFVPARLTSFLMVITSGSLRAVKYIFKYGRAHSSPNAGYPEAALAGILNVRFGGPSMYFGKKVEKPFIGENQRFFTRKDILKTVQINRLVEMLTVIILLILFFYNIVPLT